MNRAKSQDNRVYQKSKVILITLILWGEGAKESLFKEKTLKLRAEEKKKDKLRAEGSRS